ncbi:hypothetical protein BDV3_004588 [Batrachochytrium dendrobatidis]|nr:Histone acetyltransferase [Batrachochytrium dendrobatidis]KAK5672646.1 Histone acetyltransferase [Batrachochytrium dendrobatidis]
MMPATSRTKLKRAGQPTKSLAEKSPFCINCHGTSECNYFEEAENLMSCVDCPASVHPLCLKFTPEKLAIVQSHDWQCPECKCCVICEEKEDPENLLLCDQCDRGSHIYCLNPPLDAIPEGDWICQKCPQSLKINAHRNENRVLRMSPRAKSTSHINGRSRLPLTPPPKKEASKLNLKSTDLSSKAIGSERRSLRRYDTDVTKSNQTLISDYLVSASIVSLETPRTTRSRTPVSKTNPSKNATVTFSSISTEPKTTRSSSRNTPASKSHALGLTTATPTPTVNIPADTAAIKPDTHDVSMTSLTSSIPTTPNFLKAPSRSPAPSSTKNVERLKGAASSTVKFIFNNKKHKANPQIEAITAEEAHTFFSGKLSLEDSDVSRYVPQFQDRGFFHQAKEAAIAVEALSKQTSFQPLHSLPTHPLSDDQHKIASQTIPRIPIIRIGEWEINTWYAAPYPEEYNILRILYLCEFCLKYMKSEFTLARHKCKCPLTHPPGDEIYRDGDISIFEVDGRKNKIYCQNLCLLAKMFLDHKTLYYDVEPFLFYVMTIHDKRGCHFVGYFSKEKRSASNFNVSCILTLPIYQRKGYGNYLIDFSYLLSKKEERCGSPEKPLSELGALSYRYYWRVVIIQAILSRTESEISIQALSLQTRMTVDDIIHTLHLLDMIVKNDHGAYVIRCNMPALREYDEKIKAKGYPTVKPENLRWSPFLFKRPFSLR